MHPFLMVEVPYSPWDIQDYMHGTLNSKDLYVLKMKTSNKNTKTFLAATRPPCDPHGCGKVE
jgi:hypothetical protein